MAKAYSGIEGYPNFEPNYTIPYRDELKREDAYTVELRKELRKNLKEGEQPLVGKTIKHPQADGYAIYMVASEKPLEIVHLPFGDAWHASPIWIRGLRLSDVKKMVAEDEVPDSPFSEPQEV